MIIRATVHDNDFNDVMNSYFRNFINRFLDFDDDELNDDPIGVMKKTKQLMYLVNPNNQINYTDEQKQIIINRIQETFNAFVDETEKENSDYLKRKLKVTIHNSFNDQWENGEVWYWFLHSKAYINQ